MTKYRAVKTTVDGIVFDSKKEAKRYCELKLTEKAGEIYDLEIHPTFDIAVTNFKTGVDTKVCRYIADFAYKTKDVRVAGPVVIEDVKGVKTGAAYQMFRLKKKLMLAVYGITVKEI